MLVNGLLLTRDLFKMAYEKTIKPLNGSNIYTPTPYIKPNLRREECLVDHLLEKKDCTRVTQFRKTMTCSNYLETGHIARTRKNEKKDLPPKLVKPKGRSRVNIPKPTTIRRGS